MASIPGYCPHCGYVFDGHGGIHVKNSFGVRAAGNQMTCPNCGRIANLVDGTFNERGAGLELVSGPALTRAVLAQIQEVARRAKAGEITPEQAVEDVSKLSPQIGNILERSLILGMNAVLVLLGVLVYQLQLESNENQKANRHTEKQHRERVIELLERQLDTLEQENNPISVDKQGNAPSAKEAHEKPTSVHELTEREREALKNIAHTKTSKRRKRRLRGQSKRP